VCSRLRALITCGKAKNWTIWTMPGTLRTMEMGNAINWPRIDYVVHNHLADLDRKCKTVELLLGVYQFRVTKNVV